MSNLVEYAEQELRRAGLYDTDAEYGGALAAAVMRLVRVHAAEKHSEGSHEAVMRLFNRVANFRAVAPLTDNPVEWMALGPDDPQSDQTWQSRRQHSCFSNDRGKTYYDIDEQREEGATFTICSAEKHAV
jgi:hypothetical protein